VAQQQIITATIVGSISGSGNASITVTALGMNNSPKNILVPVLIGDSNVVVALKVAESLAIDTDVQSFFLVSNSTNTVILKACTASANDLTMNMASDNGSCTGLTPQPTSTITQVGINIAPVNGYCTVNDLRNYPVLQWPSTDFSQDQLFANIITSISREIDTNCARFFYQLSETKYYTPENAYRLTVDDLVSVTTLTTDDLSGSRTYPYTWATTDYDLWPYDAAQKSEPEPYMAIDVTPQGQYLFPCNNYTGYDTVYRYSTLSRNLTKSVKITGIFGWPEIPAAITEACLLWSFKTFKNYQTPYTDPDMANQKVSYVPLIDREVFAMIKNYRRARWG
jgi:hypothetical protein